MAQATQTFTGSLSRTRLDVHRIRRVHRRAIARAPDVLGLRRFGVAHDLRLFELTRGPHAPLLLSTGEGVGADELRALEELAASVRQGTGGRCGRT